MPRGRRFMSSDSTVTARKAAIPPIPYKTFMTGTKPSSARTRASAILRTGNTSANRNPAACWACQLTLFEDQESAEIDAARLRLAAMSERLWSPDSQWTYSDFATRLTHTDGLLDDLLNSINMTIPTLTQSWTGGVNASWSASGNWDIGSACGRRLRHNLRCRRDE